LKPKPALFAFSSHFLFLCIDYEIKKFIFSTAETYEAARNKLPEAEYDSTLSSSEGEMGTRKRIVPSRYSPEPSTSQLLRLPEYPNLVMAEGSGPNSYVNSTAAATTPTHSSPLFRNSSATYYERTPVSHRNDSIPHFTHCLS